MIFVECNYEPLLVNLVKALAARGADLSRGRPPWLSSGCAELAVGVGVGVVQQLVLCQFHFCLDQ